jgi:DNA modification methylase
LTDLYKGDCLEVMKTIESGSIDAIITDPPYGTTACKWDSVIPFEPMWQQLNRIIKPNGAIVLFGSEPFSSALRMSNIKNYKYDWIWEKTTKTNHLNSKKQPLRRSEIISVFYKKQSTYNPQGIIKTEVSNFRPNHFKYKKGEKVYGEQKEYSSKSNYTNYPDNILTFANPNSKSLHPTQKPIALMEYLIKTYTNENETVLDFTMGSGSTGVAAKNLNRSFIGIEQDVNYFNIAKERIEKENFKLF